MRTLKYEELLKLDYAEICSITSDDQPFIVVADAALGDRIQKFLFNERQFRASAKTLRDRLRYVIGGIHAIKLPNLMPLWNRAVMDGFVVQEVRLGNACEIVFGKS